MLPANLRGRLLRRTLVALLGVALLLCLVTPLLQGVGYVSRQGRWAADTLAQPLPLRIFTAVGRWACDHTSTQLPGDGEVGFVKFIAQGQIIEEYARAGRGGVPPTCTKAEEDAGCFVWVPRPLRRPGASRAGRGRAAEGEELTDASTRTGAVVAQFTTTAAAARRAAPLSRLHLTLQAGFDVGADVVRVSTMSVWNDTETATALPGEWRWLSFGLRSRAGVAELQATYPRESGKLDGDARLADERRSRGESTRSGFEPAVSFFEATLSSTDAVRLFADLYVRHTTEEQKSSEESRKGKKKAPVALNTTAAPVTEVGPPEFSELFYEHCFWLVEYASKDVDNPTGVSQGRAWSTCGHRLVWSADTTTYDGILSLANTLAFLGVFISGIPMILGALYQMRWMRDSRTRTLRVNPYQLIATAFMLSLSNYMLSRGSSYMPSLATSFTANSKMIFLLYSVTLVGEWILFILYFTVDREFTNYFQASESARAEASRRIIVFFIMIWVAPATVVAVGGLHNPWLAGTLACLFWLPQYTHCFTMDGWTGLTAPFTLAVWALVLTQLLAPLLIPPPWTLPRSHVIAALVGAGVLTAQGGLLLALRLNEGRNLLPHWMAPWRHRYVTTVEAQQVALRESPMCPICRNPLEEGWDENDALWRTPCNHLYHKSCLVRWMEERTECPLCRKLLPEP